MRLSVSVVRADNLTPGDMIFVENFPIGANTHPSRVTLGGENLPNFQGGEFLPILDTDHIGDDVSIRFAGSGFTLTTSEGNQFLFLGKR
jgi:hypothetical protein